MLLGTDHFTVTQYPKPSLIFSNPSSIPFYVSFADCFANGLDLRKRRSNPLARKLTRRATVATPTQYYVNPEKRALEKTISPSAAALCPSGPSIVVNYCV
jgi:hypothetical protein